MTYERRGSPDRTAVGSNPSGSDELRAQVEAVVDDIPPGRVMTYGDVAGCCGHPGAARRVGAIAHDGSPGLPWHRVVRAHGLLAQIEGSPAQWQVEHLAAEGVPVVDGRIVDFSRVRWHPELEVTTN